MNERSINILNKLNSNSYLSIIQNYWKRVRDGEKMCKIKNSAYFS